MGIKQDLATLKTVAAQGSELLLLRLRVLQMDANEQMRGVLMIAALIAAAAVLLSSLYFVSCLWFVRQVRGGCDAR